MVLIPSVCVSVYLSVSQNGDKAASPSEMTCPPGWEWEDDAWIYDINRAVDEKGTYICLPECESAERPRLTRAKVPWEEGPRLHLGHVV